MLFDPETRCISPTMELRRSPSTFMTVSVEFRGVVLQSYVRLEVRALQETQAPELTMWISPSVWA